MRCASRPASRSRTRGRGHPADRHLPHRRRGSGADDRRGPAARHLARAPRAIRASGSACRSARARFISPFNFPLNLAAHKIAPALAVGCPFVLKPASRTPLGALIIGEVLAETDLPEGAFSILPAHREGADLFTTDERLKLLSFTGSPGGRLGPEGAGRQEEGRARARRQRGGDRRRGRRPRRRGRAHRLRRLLPVGPELHRRAAHPHPRRRSTTTFRDTLVAKTQHARRRRPQGPRHLHRPDDLGGRGRAARRLDRGGGRARARRCSAAASARARCSRRRCSRTSTARRKRRMRGSVRSGRRPVELPRLRRRRSTRSTTASSASRPASSPATSSRCSTPGTGSRSAAW